MVECRCMNPFDGIKNIQHNISAHLKRWQTGQEIIFHFLGGDLLKQNMIKNELLDLSLKVNLQFVFTQNPNNAHYRVDFIEAGGAYSAVGTDALYFPKNEPNMNFGFIDKATIKHELGHGVLAWEHEHTFPDWLVFDEPYVIKYMRDNYGWLESTTRHNILDKASSNTSLTVNPDEFSIMMYYIRKDWILKPDNFHPRNNIDWSVGDLEAMKSQHPFPIVTKQNNLFENAFKVVGGDYRQLMNLNEDILVAMCNELGLDYVEKNKFTKHQEALLIMKECGHDVIL